MRALATVMCGSTPEAEVWTASGGIWSRVSDVSYLPSVFRYASALSLIASRVSAPLGPALEKKVADGL